MSDILLKLCKDLFSTSSKCGLKNQAWRVTNWYFGFLIELYWDAAGIRVCSYPYPGNGLFSATCIHYRCLWHNEMNAVTQAQILDEAVWILHNTFGECVNPTILSSYISTFTFWLILLEKGMNYLIPSGMGSHKGWYAITQRNQIKLSILLSAMGKQLSRLGF